jgi:site-specific DNA-methyltransferase (adenine-specific)
MTLILGDCLKALAGIADGTVDAVVTDPPYGISAVKRGKCFGTSNACATNTYRPIFGDDQPFDPSPLLNLAPIVCLWGANHYSHLLPKSSQWLIWDKRDGCGSNPMSDCEMAWVNIERPARLLHHRWMGMIRASEHEKRVHPAQKPVRLMKWCIEQLRLEPGATILDPYMGSGSTGLAAIQLGFNFIGIERDPGYFKIANARLAAAEAALRIGSIA